MAIEISEKKLETFKKVLQMMEALVVLDKADLKTYTTFAKTCQTHFNTLKLDPKEKMSFDEFVADFKADEQKKEISYQEYEKYIKAMMAYDNIVLLDKQKHEGWSWATFGIALSCIIKAYNRKNN